MVFEELKKYLRKPVYIEGISSRLTIHEAIKAQLYVLGYRLGLSPVLESVVTSRNRQRIDCVFVKRDNSLACAFEIDYSIKKKSIDKLLSLEDGVEKVVISYGGKNAIWKARYRNRQYLNKNGGIRHYIMSSIFQGDLSIK